MKLSDERIQEIKNLLEEKGGREYTWEEASEAAYNMAGFAELIYDCWVEDQKRKKKLAESPRGFALDGVGYTCAICHQHTLDGGNWYDKWGIKCLTCQKAIDKKIIPGSCAKNEESWYSKYDLESRFNLDRHALKRFIKAGYLKPRVVPNESGRPHTYLFLLKDNKDTLPPKKLTESHLVKETKDGKDWYHSEPWYRFFNPHEYLKGYKIMDYLQVTNPEKPEKAGVDNSTTSR